jgi:aldose 1-epimerase
MKFSKERNYHCCGPRTYFYFSFFLVAAVLYALFNVGCAREDSGQSIKTSYSFSVETDKASGQAVVALRREGPDPLEIRIAPGVGANLFSMVYKGKDLLLGPPSLAEFTGERYGIPVLYPTPCRIPKGKFTFERRSFDFGTNREDTWIHGLVRTEPWQYDTPTADEKGARVRMWIDFAPGSPLYAKFGYEHSLILDYSLDEKGILVSYTLQNRDKERLPFGFGLHPYFNYIGPRDEVYVTVPSEGYMEEENLVPTGGIGKLDGNFRDLRQTGKVSALVLDDVYTGMKPDKPATIEYRQSGIRLTLAASPEFTHMIVYDQPQNPFFCVENLTSSPDAHNLYARGFASESHLIVVPPGGESKGWVRYLIEPLKK